MTDGWRPPDYPQADVIPPDVLCVCDVTDMGCGVGESMEGDRREQVAYVTLLVAQSEVHSDAPPHPVTLYLTMAAAEVLRDALDHSDCPPPPGLDDWP